MQIKRQPKPMKPKTGRCGHRFTPTRQFQPYCPDCESNVHKGTLDTEKDLLSYTVGQLMPIAKGVFDAYIRERDKEKNCITGNHKYIKAFPMQAGHIFKCELYPGLMFDEDNCFGQCSMHNNRMDDFSIEQETIYGVMARIGDSKYADLCYRGEQLSARSPKYSRPELIEIIERYNTKLEELKASLHTKGGGEGK